MAIIQLGPAALAPAAPPPVSGVAAMRQDAGLTMGGMRDMIQVARDFMQLWKEAQPLLEMMRPPVVEQVEPYAPAPPRPRSVPSEEPVEPGPTSAPAPSAPPRDERVEAAREELRQLVEKRLSKPQILQLATAFGPFALAEKLPKLGEVLSNHATETETWLQCFSEDELRAVLVEALSSLRPREVTIARGMLAEAVAGFEREAAQKATEPAPEPKRDDEGDAAPAGVVS